MTWFKVGDELTYHPRVQRAGNAAIGLWVRAGTFCSEHLTDGWISHEDARTIGSAAEIKKLVSVGLWYEQERDGERGYQFHRWASDHLGQPRQPTREEVERKRREAADRQKRHRAKRANQGEDSQPEVTSEDSVSDAPVTRDSRVSHATPGPTRPVSPPAEESAPDKPASPRRGATRIPEPFVLTREMRQWVVEEGLDRVDVEAETREFVDFWRAATRDAMKRDWVSTWRNRMRQQQKHLVAQAAAAEPAKGMTTRERNEARIAAAKRR